MLDHRFEGEKNLAKKLEGFDYADSVSDLPTFDSSQDQLLKKSFFWPFIKILSVVSVFGVLIFYAILPHWTAPQTNIQQKKIVNDEVRNGQDVKGPKDSHQLVTSNLEEEKAIDSKIRSNDKSSAVNFDKESVGIAQNEVKESGSGTNATAANSHVSYNIGGSIKNQQRSQFSQDFTIQKDQINAEKVLGFKSDNRATAADVNNLKKDLETTDVRVNRTQENFYALYSPLSPLEIEKTLFEELLVETEPIIVEKNPRKGISFGIQFNTGNTHAGAHQTPFVSSFPTSITGGKSFGYGFFGHINLDTRNTIRPSFTYSKNVHLHFIEGLKFQTGPTDIIMELYSHELKFGLDYAFNLLPNFKVFDVKAGAGLAYHKVISLVSNNYFTEAPEVLKNANELDLSPLSYKAFLAFDVSLYKGIVFGVEPYIIYQKRTARYTPSTFIADQGDYNLISGMNLTMRF